MTYKLGRKIDTFKDAGTGIEVPIYLSKDGQFSAEVFGSIYSFPKKDELVTTVKSTIAAHSHVEWLPVIRVKYNTPRDLAGWTMTSQRIELNRLFLAQKPTGDWVEATWQSDEKTRLEHAHRFRKVFDVAQLPFHEENRHFDHSCESLFAYSDELWAALNELVVRQHELTQLVAATIRTSDPVVPLATLSLGFPKKADHLD